MLKKQERMSFGSTLWMLLFLICGVSLQESDYDHEYYEELEPTNCSVEEKIKGGYVTFSQGGLPGSLLTYHCGPGQYPSPVSSRLCEDDGEWTPMRLATGRLTSSATCKNILCPGQLQLDNGDFWPRNQWFRVGATQSFTCQDGFRLHGSPERNCTVSGDWTGSSPVCDKHEDDCDDPGIPPGAERSGGQFDIGDKVTYQCQAGLNLLGSSERVCMEQREWSGSTPRCQGPNTFDSPSYVAAAMAGSLAGVMDVVSPDFKKQKEGISFGRTIRVGDVSRMHIYILLDTSGSIKKKDFNLSREATIALIKKLDSYDIQLNFHIVSFASEAQVIVDIKETYTSSNADEVISSLTEFDYHSHGQKTGTNLYSALQAVRERISFFKENKGSAFNETQNIIIIETDGYSNTGTKPQIALAQIRELLGYGNSLQDHTSERLLDVYAFGVGDQVNKEELNSLASKKSGEQHAFVLKGYDTLGEVFNSIISDESVTMCGIAQEEISQKSQEDCIKAYTRPWHVTLTSPEWGLQKYCSGSIVSQRWVLTAAHCFNRYFGGYIPKQITIEAGGEKLNAEEVKIHPNYNTNALKHRNVSEFYDYDVALVLTTAAIRLSWAARPICLPCTIAASRALKRINSTCEEHRQELLAHKETTAFFIHKKTERKQTHIHIDGQRPACVEKARQTLKEPTNVTLDEYVPDRFLCSGGTEGYQDAITCKGDSGGSLFLQKRKRYFQVGLVSWGTTDICDRNNRAHGSNRPPPDARDFHIDLFKIMPWLKEHTGKEIKFLPEFDP
ncbi:complement C2 [Oryzias latipes]|uniref:C3/C5 convertase n=1 Tax=Oryzias latipes TaxID=8090 RepID=H2MLP7_ORYLA|nr:complement C2 [Oryzias latipes]